MPTSRTIDEYLATVDPKQRAALERLRQAIRKSAPKAEECISYGVPAFREYGMLVGFAAAAKHYSLFLMNSTTVAAFQTELSDFDTSKGTIRFLPEKPLPVALIRNLVQARLAENLARQEKRSPGRPVASRQKKSAKTAMAVKHSKARRK